MDQKSTWLEQYLQYTSDHEAPLLYHTWMGIGTIAAALERKVWTEHGMDYLYPNFYIILVSPAAQSRKTGALRIAQQLLNKLEEAKLIAIKAESITGPSVIDELKGDSSKFTWQDKEIQYHAITFIASELKTLIKRGADDLVTYLIGLYDCDTHFRYSTKGAGKYFMKNVCANILGATVPSFFRENREFDLIATGFPSRCVFVYANRARFRKRRQYMDTELLNNLTADLIQINQISGEIKMDTKADEFFTAWYENLTFNHECIDALIPYMERKPSHILKLAMILSISEKFKLYDYTINLHHIERAKKILDALENNMSMVFGGIGASPDSEALTLIITKISEKGDIGISRKDLLRQVICHIEKSRIELIIGILIGELQTVIAEERNHTIWYRWVGERITI